MNKTDQSSCSWGAYILIGREKQDTITIVCSKCHKTFANLSAKGKEKKNKVKGSGMEKGIKLDLVEKVAFE